MRNFLQSVSRIAALAVLSVLCIFGLTRIIDDFAPNVEAQIISHSAILPTQITIVQQNIATAATNYNSGILRFWGSLWNGTQAETDEWTMQVVENSCALTCGSDLEINHSTGNGAGRFHVDSDFIVGPPADATSTQNDNSFAWDVEGSYWDGTQAQNDIWESTVGTTPATGGSINARLNIYPVFPSACPTCTADVALGALGTNPQQGNPAGPPMFDFPVLPRDGFTLTLEHDIGNFTGNRTQWFADKSGPIGIAWRQTCTLAAGTCTVNFTQGPYISAPICTANGQTVANAFSVSSTTSAVTIHSSSSTDTQTANILCVENGEN
ncbi:MAG: hypothetical protein ACYDD2_13090 [Candidatus Acidiferrales bacterium]